MLFLFRHKFIVEIRSCDIKFLSRWNIWKRILNRLKCLMKIWVFTVVHCHKSIEKWRKWRVIAYVLYKNKKNVNKYSGSFLKIKENEILEFIHLKYLIGKDTDFLSINNKFSIFMWNYTFKFTMCWIIFKHINHIINRNKWILKDIFYKTY